jgi:AcrR family transcriptional regulator
VLAERGYPAATIREIAARAGVNPALVGYYFGSKKGLHAAILERVVETLGERISGVLGGEGSPAERLQELVRSWVRIVAHDPYLPRMVVEEVLAPEGELLERFASRFAAPLAREVLGVVAEGVESGELRASHLPFVLPSIVGLSVFFFLAAPMLRRVLGIDPSDPAVAEAWGEHAADLLLHGLAPRVEAGT